MSTRIDQKRAELALLEAEHAFAEKKAAGTVTEADKLELRALRQSFRTDHRQAKPGAAPAAINPKVK